MTQDEIIEMAREAGFDMSPISSAVPKLKRFAILVASKEREAFAKIQFESILQAIKIEREACAEILDANAMACHSPIMRSLLQSNAQAIRARGQA
jgi:hypothetical protein